VGTDILEEHTASILRAEVLQVHMPSQPRRPPTASLMCENLKSHKPTLVLKQHTFFFECYLSVLALNENSSYVLFIFHCAPKVKTHMDVNLAIAEPMILSLSAVSLNTLAKAVIDLCEVCVVALSCIKYIRSSPSYEGGC
jgi:hypothetical protein